MIDPVAVIEKAHLLAEQGDPRAWLERVADLVLPALSEAWVGGLAVMAEPPPPEPLVIPVRRPPSACQADALDEEALDAVLRAALASAGRAHRAAASEAVRRPGVTSLMEAVGSLPPWTEQASPLRLGDVVVLSVPGRGGRLALFAVVTPERARLDDTTRRLFHRLAVHLSHSLSRLGTTVEPRPPSEALTLSVGARDDLHRAIRELYRRHLPDPGEGLELWRGVLTGRWSLVDRFEEDGRRYVLARQNAAGDHAARLSPRQRQVAFFAALGCSNKEIGFALGLAENTVSAHLARAMDKMGIRSRTELVRLSTQVTVGAEARVA